MRKNPLLSKMLAVAIFFSLLPVLTFAQASNAVPSQAGNVASRINQAIDESQLTLLKGNTHPLARTEFDRGAATSGLTLHRMLLSLKRSPEQESALRQFLVDLQDKSSPNYHQWLTPDGFGRQFGPSDQDMQTVTAWLESHGFQVTNVTKGRTVIEFTGTVSQVSEAFHTQIHKYSVQGEEHWANASDPKIPSALTPVVAGVATLHNFVKKSHLKTAGIMGHGSVTDGAKPSINFSDGRHGVGPADFAKIYNVPNSLNAGATSGDGIAIGVVARSNISASDVQNFRTLFGIPTPFTAANNIVLNGPDPGNLGGGEEFEAVLDASWSGAAAPNATVKFVVSQTTETTDGVDLSEVFIIDNNLAPVMTESFGLCEAFVKQISNTQAANEASLAEQAAAQGITFIASTGDAGASGCDDPNAETVATQPIGVQLPAALPFTVALGGTQFIQNDAAFWGPSNANGTLESAISFIPEDVWNESCATASACFADVIAAGAGPNILAGGGGASTIFAKPAFQTGVSGLPPANFRAVPDVSLNAAVFHDSTALCVADQAPAANQCIQPGGQFFVLLVGGTSVAAPSFAGIMALVNEVAGRQGEAGFVLYKLAATEDFSKCNASTGNGPTITTCIFNDVTSGNNAVPGQANFGTANAVFQAGTGYDEASGLGSVNVANLLSKWNTAQPNQSKTTLAIPVVPTSHGGSATVTISVAAKTGSGVPTGDVALIANTGANGQTGGITLATMQLVAGAVATTTTALPGGTNYNVTAHYEGDGTFMPSDSNTVAVTVGKEASTTLVDFIAFDPNTFKETDNATTATYGANIIRINVTGTSGSCANNAAGSSGCPTGTITLTDGGTPLDGGNFALSSQGTTEDQASLLAPGKHSLAASYSGDASFTASGPTAADSITITQGPTNVALTSSASNIASGGVVTLTAVVNTGSSGLAPTGTVQFFNGSTMITGNVVLTPFRPNSFFLQGAATLTATLTTTLSAVPSAGPTRTPNLLRPVPLTLFALGALLCLFVLRYASANRRRYAYVGLIFAVLMLAGMAACGGGGGGGHAHTDTITAKYSGDTNYTGSTSTAVMITVQ